MSRRYTPVQIHQNTKEPSINSDFSRSTGPYASSSGSSTPRSMSLAPGEYREYGAVGYTSQVVRSGENIVINHNKVGYESNSPRASYTGGYSSRRSS